MTDRAKKISELNALAANTVANTDLFVVVDTSASETKKLTANSLAVYIGSNIAIPGPFDTDGAASAGSVAVGKPYYTSAGAVKVRLT